MATFSSVTRHHVLQALAEYDTRGGEEFLDLYGFTPARGYTLVHESRSYDAKAILGVAHRHATGRLATSEDVTNGIAGAVAILRKRGFDVSEPASAPRAPQPRSRRPSRAPATRAAATREAPATICPTCSMALPATGICDDCG